jgi:hypothetical protein
MSSSNTEWSVSAHGPIEKLEDNLWSVAGTLPGMALRRRMVIMRLSSGKLVVHSAVALEEASMREIEAWGEVAYIIVPNGYHRVDAPRYKARYPNAKVLCPKTATSRVAQVVAVDGDIETLPSDASVRYELVSGTAGGEYLFVVTSSSGHVTLVINDLVFNHPHASGFAGFVMRMIGSSGAPRVTLIARMLLVKDKSEVRAQLSKLADLPGLTRIVPSHVDLIEGPAADTLRQVAGAL